MENLGYCTNLLSEVEESIDVLIPLFYANDLSYTIFETEAMVNLREIRIVVVIPELCFQKQD